MNVTSYNADDLINSVYSLYIKDVHASEVYDNDLVNRNVLFGNSSFFLSAATWWVCFFLPDNKKSLIN